MRRAQSLLLLLTLLLLPRPGNAGPGPAARLLFLRGGDLWSAAADGSDQRVAISAGASLVRYRVAPTGDQVAAVRKIGGLDALEIHDLSSGQVTLVRAAEGLIGDIAWARGKQQALGYLYQPTAEATATLFVTNGAGPGKKSVALAEGERLMALYPGDGGVVLVTRNTAGLAWRLCGPSGASQLTGYPGKTIASMPLATGGWLTSLYAPGVGRSLAVLHPGQQTLEARASIDLPRSDLSWSHSPAWTTATGLHRVVVRQDEFDVAGASTSQRVIVWDVASGQQTPVAFPGQVLLGTPEPEPGSNRFVVCTQFRDGAGYGTAPALWAYSWAGEGPRLLVAEGTDPQWWIPATLMSAPKGATPEPGGTETPHIPDGSGDGGIPTGDPAPGGTPREF